MNPVDAFWHLANFFVPALCVGAVAAAGSKLLWWRELKAVRWWRLAAWCAGSSALALLAGLVVFGRDGKMATYGAMVLVGAVSLWWAGFGSHRLPPPRPGRQPAVRAPRNE